MQSLVVKLQATSRMICPGKTTARRCNAAVCTLIILVWAHLITLAVADDGIHSALPHYAQDAEQTLQVSHGLDEMPTASDQRDGGGTIAAGEATSAPSCSSTLSLTAPINIMHWLPPTTSSESSMSSVMTSALLTADHTTKLKWNAITVVALLLTCCCALLANSAGIGGGPFYMPLFNSVLGFSLNAATGLSHTMVASSGVASTIYGILQQSPVDPTKPLVDFDLALTFIPPLLFGVGFGVLLNPILPSWLQVGALAFLLAFMTRETAGKAKKAWEKETKEHQKKAAESAQSAAEGLSSSVDASATSNISLEDGAEQQAEQQPIRWLEKGSQTSSQFLLRTLNGLWPLAKLLALWTAFLLLELGLSQSKQCTARFFTFWAAQTGLCFAVSAAMLFSHHKGATPDNTSDVSQPLLGGGSAEGSEGSSKSIFKVVGVMVLAGVVAGSLGIGGAPLFNPFLLSLGIQPQIVASTSVMMVLFSSSSVSLSFVFHGLLNLHFAAVFAPAAFLSSLLGVTIVGNIVKKTGRASIIIYILTTIIGIGTTLTVVLGGLGVISDFAHGTNLWFKSLC